MLVEDEASLAHGLEFNLSEEGYVVDWAADGKIALEKFEKNEYDLIILDIMLPYFDGFEIAEIVRKKLPRLPILILTARGEALDKLRGLKLGADDYLTKPFNLDELLLRVKGMLRRQSWYNATTDLSVKVSFGDNEVDFSTLQAKNGKSNFQLTQMEATVLKYLMENKNRIISRKELLKNVWHLNDDIETRTVDNFVMRLRKYFEDNPSQPKYFQSIRSSGYRFVDSI